MADKPPISGPASGKGVNCLIVNIIVPGLGSIIAGRTSVGVLQLALALIGIPLIFFHFVGLFVIPAAYIWSIVTGVQIMQASVEPAGRAERPPDEDAL